MPRSMMPLGERFLRSGTGIFGGVSGGVARARRGEPCDAPLSSASSGIALKSKLLGSALGPTLTLGSKLGLASSWLSRGWLRSSSTLCSLSTCLTCSAHRASPSVGTGD